jgi:glycosyltransferase involved in cell wall biosynthesis
LRVVVLSPWFAENMGYIENALPPALGRLGAEVHVVTSQLQPHFDRPNYIEQYEPFTGPAIQDAGTTERDGFSLHRLRYRLRAGHVVLRGFGRKIKELRPDVVQVFAPVSWITLQAAWRAPLRRYRFFTGAHRTVSSFPLAQPNPGLRLKERLVVFASRTLPGRVLSWFTTACHAATVDCADVAARFYGVPRRKLRLAPLGVDTSRFHPAVSAAEEEAAAAVRSRHGLAEEDILCLYTGRLGPDKNPLLLARAVELLRRSGLPYRALFVGAGPQQAAIEALDGSTVEGFVPWSSLPEFYRSAEIGVWPFGESISMLDAAACGIPIVVSDRVQATERFEGNGLTYPEGDVHGLAESLRTLDRPAIRRSLGDEGTRKVSELFSWETLARQRLADYDST